MKEAVIVSAVRTPLGSFNGSLAGIGAIEVVAPVVSTPGNPQDVQLVGGDLIFSVTNNSGSYRIQGNTNLANGAGWVDIATNAAPFSFTNSANQPQQFFRTVTP